MILVHDHVILTHDERRDLGGTSVRYNRATFTDSAFLSWWALNRYHPLTFGTVSYYALYIKHAASQPTPDYWPGVFAIVAQE